MLFTQVLVPSHLLVSVSVATHCPPSATMLFSHLAVALLHARPLRQSAVAIQGSPTPLRARPQVFLSEKHSSPVSHSSVRVHAPPRAIGVWHCCLLTHLSPSAHGRVSRKPAPVAERRICILTSSTAHSARIDIASPDAALSRSGTITIAETDKSRYKRNPCRAHALLQPLDLRENKWVILEDQIRKGVLWVILNALDLLKFISD